MLKKPSKTLLSFAVLAASAGYVNVVAADSKLMEEVIVTAQNREQDLQSVPIAINVIGGEKIERVGFASLDDVEKISPVVQLNQDQGTVKLSMRGVGTTTNDEAQDTSIVVNVDGEYINRLHVLAMGIFDIERVEVLRGPQGTLYGRNSTGGALNFITRKPGEEFGGKASLTIGNYGAVRFDGALDLPISEGNAVRIALFEDERDGYNTHKAGWGFGPFPAYSGGESDDLDAWGGRISYAHTSDNVDVNLAYEHVGREMTPSSFAYVDLNSLGPKGPGCNAPGFVEVGQAYPQTLCIPQSTNFLKDVDRSGFGVPAFGLGFIKQEADAFRAKIAYQLNENQTLTYTGGFRSFSIDPSSNLTLPVVYTTYNYQNDIDTQSHEIRLNGETDSGMIYQMGAFYFSEDIDAVNNFTLFQDISISYFERHVQSDSMSLFGQFEKPMNETTTLVAGVRYTDNERKAIFNNAGAFGMGPPDPLLFHATPARHDFEDLAHGVSIPLGNTEDELTWTFGVNYTPDEDTLAYAKVSKGFKGGGFDSVGIYKPETNQAYEVGLKRTVDGDKYNASAFMYDYSDLQVSVLLDTSVGGQVFNAASATIWGLEFESQMLVGDSGLFSTSINYLNAEYDDFLGQFNVLTVAGTGADVNGIGDLDPNTAAIEQPNFKGNTPPFSPEWVITAGYDHEFSLSGGGTIIASISTLYKSSYFTEFFNYADSEQEDYTKTDISLEYKTADEKWSVQIFGRNLEDERNVTYASFVSAGPDDIYNWQFGAPRTYGVRIGYEF